MSGTIQPTATGLKRRCFGMRVRKVVRPPTTCWAEFSTSTPTG
nr:hypothetical protein [Actinomadura madurae]